jgi:hypothetical protein
MHSGNISYKKVDEIFFCSNFNFFGSEYVFYDAVRQFRDKIRTTQIVGQNSGYIALITSWDKKIRHQHGVR